MNNNQNRIISFLMFAIYFVLLVTISSCNTQYNTSSVVNSYSSNVNYYEVQTEKTKLYNSVSEKTVFVTFEGGLFKNKNESLENRTSSGIIVEIKDLKNNTYEYISEDKSDGEYILSVITMCDVFSFIALDQDTNKTKNDNLLDHLNKLEITLNLHQLIINKGNIINVCYDPLTQLMLIKAKFNLQDLRNVCYSKKISVEQINLQCNNDDSYKIVKTDYCWECILVGCLLNENCKLGDSFVDCYCGYESTFSPLYCGYLRTPLIGAPVFGCFDNKFKGLVKEIVSLNQKYIEEKTKIQEKKMSLSHEVFSVLNPSIIAIVLDLFSKHYNNEKNEKFFTLKRFFYDYGEKRLFSIHSNYFNFLDTMKPTNDVIKDTINEITTVLNETKK